jgi:hypothetical protein
MNGSVHNISGISGNRLLSITDADDPDSDSLIARILDFDSSRVAKLVDLSEKERDELKANLEKDGARVQIVTRRFNINAVGEEDDGEFPYPAQPTQEWNDHLHKLYTDKLALLEEKGEDGLPALEYDEAPEEHRKDVLFGYTDSRVKLPDGVDPTCLALTKSAVVMVPKFGSKEDWVVMDFEE